MPELVGDAGLAQYAEAVRLREEAEHVPWKLPRAPRPRFGHSEAPWLPVVSVPISGWGAALSLGLVNLVFLAALVAISLLLLARAYARCCLAVLAPSPAE
ncbi:hypothetical protein ACFRCI_19085 [Streptomyces sp. NPDC056638]|uniref:hypothetical protein n=1 Tax=Streptomyces sp. NPDC056638 TaxID=3345887 RepID=UPI0036C1E5E3